MGCLPKTSSDTEGAKNLESCKACAVGTIASWCVRECNQCEKGTYERDNTQCVACPMGTFSDEKGASTSCKACAPGSTASSEKSTSCQTCKAGTYESGRKECSKCPTGQFSTENAAISCASCSFGYGSEEGSKNCKMTGMLIAIIALVVIIILVVIFFVFKKCQAKKLQADLSQKAGHQASRQPYARVA